MRGKGDEPLFERIGLSKSFAKLKRGHGERNRQGQILAGEKGGEKGEKRKEKKIRSKGVEVRNSFKQKTKERKERRKEK